IGALLGATVLDGLGKLKSLPEPALAFRSAKVDIPLRQYTPEQIARAPADMAKIGTKQLKFLEQVETYSIMARQLLPGDTLPMEVQVFRLDRTTAIVTLPGEIFVELGLAIKRASPFR